jgi:hypothetical protein
MQFLGGDHRKSIPKIKPHLVTKNAFRSGSGAIGFLNAFVENMSKKV